MPKGVVAARMSLGYRLEVICGANSVHGCYFFMVFINRQTDRRAEVRTDGWMGGWMDGWMGGWVDGWVGGWMNGGMGGWVGGRVDGWIDEERTRTRIFYFTRIFV